MVKPSLPQVKGDVDTEDSRSCKIEHKRSDILFLALLIEATLSLDGMNTQRTFYKLNSRDRSEKLRESMTDVQYFFIPIVIIIPAYLIISLTLTPSNEHFTASRTTPAWPGNSASPNP